jgi:NTP pyrophosphatase (non-canonical NTP hydrolase)
LGDIRKVQTDIYQIALDHGFWSDEENRNIPSKLMLTVAEVAEALEEWRKEEIDYSAFGVELADVVIRVMDIAAYLNIDLETHILDKIERNRARPYKHGKRF